MPEVIDAELRLEAVLGLAPGDRHHARVVTEHVDRVVVGGEPIGEISHRVERREVALSHVEFAVDVAAGVGADLVGRGLGAFGAPTRHHHRGALRGERARTLVTEPAVRAGDDHRLPVQSRHLLGGPFCHRSRKGRRGEKPVDGIERFRVVRFVPE